MKNAKLCFITVLFLCALTMSVSAQKKKPVVVKKAPAKTTQTQTKTPPKTTGVKSAPAKEEKRDEQTDQTKVRDMVTFLEYVLNTLGSSTTSARDKDVLVTQSYAKIFRDGKVQVEDDLDDERTVNTNKDIVAYLKDVDFFFTDVKFEFTIDEIKSDINASGKTFYKVSIKRNLKGTTTEGKAINNTLPRYIEVNYDPDAQDLKIVSVYTHEINEKDALINWWKDLSLEWKDMFREKLSLGDSVPYSDLKRLAAMTSLDISGNRFIQTLDPLSRLTLLQTLNVSKTGISNVSPLRNLTELVELNASQTLIDDITALKYSDKIIKLDLHQTQVKDISVLEKMPKIQVLDISRTPVTDFSSISELTELQELNLSGTKISDLTSLSGLTAVTTLNLSNTSTQDVGELKGIKSITTLVIDSTSVSDITPLGDLENLKVLHANRSRISVLTPLAKLTKLEKVYVDHTAINKDISDKFTAQNGKILVIFDSEDLKSWWDGLTPEWKEVISKTVNISASPTKEELAKVGNEDSINVSGNMAIKNLEPLRKMLKLKSIVADRTGITTLDALQEHHELRYLDISQTAISDITVARQFNDLRIMRADKSQIQNIDPLNRIAGLRKLYVDETAIHDITALEFLEKNSKCLLVYKTIHLNRWWKKLPENWRAAFRTSMGNDTTATRENLHKLAELETLTLQDAQVNDLTALSEFVRIRNLDFSGTAITDLGPLVTMKTLRSLHATNGPLQKIEVLSQLTELEDLDISNTPIDDLRPIEHLENLAKFNCAGTQIKRLDALDKIQHLEYLDCSNTKVGNLDAMTGHPLKTIKCYNTKISARAIESFKKANPGCNVVYYR